MQSSLYTYAWDLADEGVAEVTGRMRDAGLTAITVASSYHAGRFLRPHGRTGRSVFPEDGTVYFRPDPSRYGRLKPRAASMVDTFDAFAALEREAPDLPRVAWTVGLHNARLGFDNPDLVARNAYGDPFFPSLCPASEAARDYVVGLCRDVAERHDIQAVALETPGWLPFRHGYHHEFELVAMNPHAELALGLCFCDHCRRAAGAAGHDIEAVRCWAVDAADRFLSGEATPGADAARDAIAADLFARPDLVGFLRWRATVVTALVAAVRAAVRPEVGVRVIPTVQSPNALAWIEGSDLAALAAAADGLEVPAYQVGPEAIRADLADVRRRVGASARLSAILRPAAPTITSAGELGEAVASVRAAGAESVGFYNYGHLRLSALDWIAAALR